MARQATNHCEVLRKYLNSTDNLKKAQLACKELRSKYEQVTQNLNRLQLENERISFNLKTVQSENNQLTIENNGLKEHILSLEDHYNKHIIESQSTIKNLEGELQMLQELNNFDSLSPVKKEQVCNEESNERIKQLERDSENLQKLESEYMDVLNKLTIRNNELCEKFNLMEKDKATIVQLSKENRCLQAEVQDLKNEIMIYVESKLCPMEFEKIKTQLSIKLKELEAITHENRRLSEQLFKASEDLEEVKAKVNIQKPCLRNNCAQTVESIFTNTNHDYIETNAMNTVEQSIEDIMKEMTKLPLILTPLRENEDEIIDMENNVVPSEQDLKENSAGKFINGRLLKRQKYRIPFIGKEFIKFWYNRGVIKKRKKMRRRKLIKKRDQDSILTALQILKKSKINFTISNESLLSWPGCGCDNYRRSMIKIPSQIPPKNSLKLHTETLACDNCNGFSSQMILNKMGTSHLELLGFVNVKKEAVTSRTGLIEYITKYENLNSLQKQFQNKEPLRMGSVHTLTEKSDKFSDSFHSRTEKEVEHLFQNNLCLEKADQENLKKFLTTSNDFNFTVLPNTIDIKEASKSELSINTITQVVESTISNCLNKEDKDVMQNNDSLKVLCSYTHRPGLQSPLSSTTNANSDTYLKEVDAVMKDTSDLFLPQETGNGSIKITANDILSFLPLEIRTTINEDNIPTCPDSPDPFEKQIECFSPKMIPLDLKSPSPNRRSKRIIEKLQSSSFDVPNIYSCDRLQRIISDEMVENFKSSDSNSIVETTQANSFCETIVPIKRKRGRPLKQSIDNSGNNSLHTQPYLLLDTESFPFNQGQCVGDKKLSLKKKTISKLKSKILKEVRERRKMYQTKPIGVSQGNQVSKSNLYESDSKINELKSTEVKTNIKVDKKINVVQNILIPPDSSCPVDLLSNRSNHVHLDRIGKKNIINRNKNKNGYSSNDVLSQIMGEMDKKVPKFIPKLQRKVVTFSSIEDKEWRKKILDIADILYGNDHNTVGNRLLSKCDEFITNPTWRKGWLSSKLKLLMKKLLTLSSDEDIREDIVTEFKRLKVDTIADVILHKVSRDIVDKPDINHFPAPLMTRSQRIYLTLMLRLEKEKMENLIDTFLAKAERLLFRANSGVRAVVPITRLYVAICRLRGDVNLIRVFCCKAFYSMGDLAVPLLFTVLTSWIEVFPKEADLIHYPMTKVLVQIVLLKTCNNGDHNLLPLKSLLHQFYGYPKERWNCDEMFEQLCQDFLRNPGDISNFALKLFCKNKDSKWVSKKINEFFKPLIYKIPAENENFKATVIILLGNICRQFKRSRPEEEVILLDMQRWMEGLLEDNPSGLVPQSVQLVLNILRKNRKRTKKTVIKTKKKTKKAPITKSSINVSGKQK